MTSPGPVRFPARSIAEWNPFDLGVHRAITVGGPQTDDQLPDLPGYLRRPHDDELADLLDDVSVSVMVVLSGESSTGKTRALYESVLASNSLRDWPLWYPRTADDLLQLLQSSRLTAGTVLWLNETHNQLSGPTGDLAAAALRDLLDGSRDGPFVVVGTLWPQFWAELVAQPRSGQRDEHANARALLQHRAHRIRVAEQLSRAEVARVRATSSVDPRLAAAASASGDGRRVIQTMAGGPMLVERFEHPDDADDRYATAILTAAVDARRLGHLQPLPRALLEDAADGYLGEHDRVNPPEDWFSRGLARAADEAVLGVTALVARRKQSGTGPPDGYELHDYLDQHGRGARRCTPAPAALWEACLVHTAHAEDLVRLTENAYQRLLYRYADPLADRALDLADQDSWSHLVDVLAEYGRVERAVAVLRATGEADDPRPFLRVLRHSHETVTTALIETGRVSDAELLLQTLVTFGRDTRWAWRTLTDLLVGEGRTEEAIDLLRRLGTRGQAADSLAEDEPSVRLPGITATRALVVDSHAIGERLADLLADTGRWDEALVVAQTSAGPWPRAWLAKKFAKYGRMDRLRSLAEVGDATVSLILAEKLLEDGEVSEAVQLVNETGRSDPSARLLELLVQHGHQELAIRRVVSQDWTHSAELLRALAGALLTHGHEDRLVDLLVQLTEAAAASFSYAEDEIPEAVADLLADVECWDEALKIARRDSAWARRWVAKRLAAAGNFAQVRRLAEMGNEWAGTELIRFLVDSRQSQEAFALLRESADSGMDWADRELAALLAASRRWDELIGRATGGSHHAARTLLAMAHQGRLPEAGQLLEQGLSTEGRA